MPGAGPLDYLRTPKPDENTRIETGVREGKNLHLELILLDIQSFQISLQELKIWFIWVHLLWW